MFYSEVYDELVRISFLGMLLLNSVSFSAGDCKHLKQNPPWEGLQDQYLRHCSTGKSAI